MKSESKIKQKEIRKCAAKKCTNNARPYGRKNLCWAHLNRLRRKGVLGDSPIKTVTKHGMSKTRVYDLWCGMITRCSNDKVDSYKYYGAKGIKVSNSWLNFNNFFKDMGAPPSKLHSIDRIDNSKNYSKLNCRWATPIEQANNTSRSILVEHNGEKHPFYVWERKTGISRKTLYGRYRLGWRGEKLFSALNPYGVGVPRKRLKKEREALALERLIG